jgi:hypothetical protein
VSISFISAHLPNLVGHGHEPQPSGSDQGGNKDRLRDCASGFGAQMRLECCPVCGLSGENALTRFIMLLSRRRGHDRIDHGVVHLQAIGEMLCHMRRHRAGGQSITERGVAGADLSVAETADKLAPTYPECSGAIQDEPPNRIFVLEEARLNR